MKTFKATLVAATLALSAPAWAQSPAMGDDALAKAAMAGTSTTVPNGWDVKLNVGGTLSFQHSNSVAASAGLGQQGATFQLGFVLGGAANWKHDQHRVENSLGIQHTQTKTPDTPFRKSLDNIEFLSTYLYTLKSIPWLGPFVRVRATSQIINSYYYAPLDGSVTNARVRTINDDNDVVEGADQALDEGRFQQTSPFEPLVFRETAGVFARPYESPNFTLDGKLGIGSQQLIARDGRVFSGDIDGTTAVFNDISSAVDLGAEAEVGMKGILVADLLSWRWNTNLYLPFASTGNVISGDSTEGTTPTGFDFLVVNTQIGLSLKLAKWLSIDYTLAVLRQPIVTAGFQVQNGILVTAGFDVL